MQESLSGSRGMGVNTHLYRCYKYNKTFNLGIPNQPQGTTDRNSRCCGFFSHFCSPLEVCCLLQWVFKMSWAQIMRETQTFNFHWYQQNMCVTTQLCQTWCKLPASEKTKLQSSKICLHTQGFIKKEQTEVGWECWSAWG